MRRHTDLTYLREIADGSDTFIVEMLNLFIGQTPQSLIYIDKALKDKDWKLLRFSIHKMKPSIMFVGLSEIKKDALLLERYTEEESHLEAIPALVDKVKKVCNEAIIELKEELKKLQ